ncbi:MAG: DUF6602 domain-containing protein [Terracidiphilus sp.]
MKFDEFDQYSENMLLGQYEISEIITHELMKGEVREDFLIATLKSCSEPEPIIVKGTISDGTSDAGQLDIVLCRPNSHIRKLGTQCVIRKDDSLCIIEVKGNCTGKDLKRAELKATKIRDLRGEQSPLFGVVCYKVALEELTIMRRFGFSFDNESRTYFDSATLASVAEADWEGIEYPTLDFFISIEEEKKIFLRKYPIRPGHERFVRLTSSPLIKDLFDMVQSLLRSAIRD